VKVLVVLDEPSRNTDNFEHNPLGGVSSSKGTVYFSSPLYRKNLHYKVLPKPAAAKDVLRAMSEYILENHKDESGIVYCYRRKVSIAGLAYPTPLVVSARLQDTEEVADGLQQHSNGLIKTGVYHAEIGDAAKEQLHARWRKGEIKIVCATIGE
jgi:ATP-dependent DNA helicase Q1